MRRCIIALLLVSLVLFSCGNKTKMLTGTWRAVKLENPEMDSFFTNGQNYIDTIGKGHDDSTNIRLYGVANMDSVRRGLQAQYDTAKAMQLNALGNTVFRFRKDGIAVLTFNGVVDSAKWYTDNKDSVIVLDDIHTSNSTDKVNMDILKLTDVVLKLRVKEAGVASTVTFRREGK